MSFKFNPFTGNLDIIEGGTAGVDNFSFHTVASIVTVTIPEYQQMTVHGVFNLLGTLIIESTGELLLL